MSTPTLEQVFHDAQQLPIADQQLLVELLKPPKTIEQLAEERGIGPFDFEAARAEAAGVWPEDESIDDFIAALRRWRCEGAREYDPTDDVELEYDLPAIRERARREEREYRGGLSGHLVRLAPDVAEFFKSAEAVNEALRRVMCEAKKKTEKKINE
jgi:hypothetical protein